MFGSLEGLADPDTLVVPPSAELQELAATATQVCGEVERVLETRWGAAAKHATATERVQRAQAEVRASVMTACTHARTHVCPALRRWMRAWRSRPTLSSASPSPARS